MEHPASISIVGVETKTFPYEKVKDTVVCIQGLYYRRDSQDLVRLKSPKTGKLRFFRKNSPLLCQDINGKYTFKASCFRTEDGLWLDKEDEDNIKIGDKYHRKSYCINIENRWYLKSDPNIVSTRGGNYTLKDNAIQLSPKYYGNNIWVAKKQNDPNYRETSEGFILRDDALEFWSVQENKNVFIHARTTKEIKSFPVTIDFQDKTNPQEDRLKNVHADFKYADAFIDFELSPNSIIRIPKTLLEYFENAKTTHIMPRYTREQETIRASVNKNFSDIDENENIARNFKVINKPYAGKQNIYTPPNYPEIVYSNAFSRTGGLKYSFGVEFETSQGLVSNASLNSINLMAVGDRSIGAAEYVTSPLQGNNGVDAIEIICELLNKDTLVDDRCGIHIHVGNCMLPSKNKPTLSAKEEILFNKNFLINSIKLGSYLEEELFMSLPKNRKPTLYHCHSIRRFSDITDENFDEYLGAYVFGPKELWYDEHKQPIQPFKFSNFKLNSTRNHKTSVGTWAEGRYKWLNLIPSYTNTKHRTIEFRIFSASTVFEKVYAYILTSLAFTYVAGNKTTIIKPGITLNDIFNAAFTTRPALVSFLNEFYEDRKKKFNRKNIYPTDHPYLILK